MVKSTALTATLQRIIQYSDNRPARTTPPVPVTVTVTLTQPAPPTPAAATPTTVSLPATFQATDFPVDTTALDNTVSVDLDSILNAEELPLLVVEDYDEPATGDTTLHTPPPPEFYE